MNKQQEQVNANDVIKYLQQELTDKSLDIAILKAKLAEELAKKDDAKQETEPAEPAQEGEN